MAGRDACTDADIGKLIYPRVDAVMKDGISILMKDKTIAPHLRLETNIAVLAKEELRKVFL